MIAVIQGGASLLRGGGTQATPVGPLRWLVWGALGNEQKPHPNAPYYPDHTILVPEDGSFMLGPRPRSFHTFFTTEHHSYGSFKYLGVYILDPVFQYESFS